MRGGAFLLSGSVFKFSFSFFFPRGFSRPVGISLASPSGFNCSVFVEKNVCSFYPFFLDFLIIVLFFFIVFFSLFLSSSTSSCGSESSGLSIFLVVLGLEPRGREEEGSEAGRIQIWVLGRGIKEAERTGALRYMRSCSSRLRSKFGQYCRRRS